MPTTHRTAALLLLAGAAACSAGVMDDLKAKMDAAMEAPGENLFPDPQDQALARIRFQPDRVLWLFREAQAKALEEGYLAEMLRDALRVKHQEQAWALTRRLREAHQGGRERPLKTFAAALAEPPLPRDLAAFLPVLERLPEGLRTGYAAAEAAARAAAAELEDPATRAAYVAACQASPDFYRRKGWARRLWGKAREGLDGLIDRLEVRFTRENLARFARLGKSRLAPEVRERAQRAARSMQERLVEGILEDLDDHLEGGLGGKVQAIELAGGYLRTKTSLTRGRLRVFLKVLDGLRQDPADLRAFLPSLRQVHQGIKARRRRGELDEAGSAWLEKLDEMLETSSMVLGLAARKQASEPTRWNVWKAVWEALVAEDLEGLFAGVEAEPDLL